MDTKTGLDVLECEIAQIEATVFMLKLCLETLRYSIISEHDAFLKDMRREDTKTAKVTHARHVK
jgi:hypothetical protein